MPKKLELKEKQLKASIDLKPIELQETNASKVANKLTDLSNVSKAIKAQMKDTVDFYTLPDADKPALSKIGAQKIALLFGLTAKTELVDKVEERGDEPYFEYTYRVSFFKNGIELSSNEASCNSEENSWGKAKDNPYSIASNVRQKAQKRAYVQAILLIANIGELFTADMDEIKKRKETEEIGQKKLMILYRLVPTNKTAEKEQQEQRRERRKEICQDWNKKHKDTKYLDFAEVSQANYESFKNHIKDYREKWA